MSISRRNIERKEYCKEKYPDWDKLDFATQQEIMKKEFWEVEHPLMGYLTQCFSEKYRKYTIAWGIVLAITLPGLYLIYDGVYGDVLIKYFIWVFLVMLVGGVLYFTINSFDQKKS